MVDTFVKVKGVEPLEYKNKQQVEQQGNSSQGSGTLTLDEYFDPVSMGCLQQHNK